MKINLCKVTFLLYQLLLIFLNHFIVYLFRQTDCQKKSFHLQAARDYFLFHSRLSGPWIGNKQLFKVGLMWICIIPPRVLMCFKRFCFRDCWNILSVVHVFKNVSNRSVTETYHLAQLSVLFLVRSLKSF